MAIKNVENVSELERRLTITVPLEPLKAQVDARLKDVAKTAKFSGFRPGKAPIGLVNQQYGDQIRDEVFSQAVQESFGEAVEEQKLRVAGFPDIEHKPFDEQSDELEYVASFEIFPEVKLGDLSKATIERPALDIKAADVKRTLDVLVKQRTTYEPVKRAAKEGDRVNVVLKASIEGEEVESTGDEGINLVIGEGGRVPSFDEALSGAKTGDNKQFDVTYPDDHQPATIAGKVVTYDVTFNAVEKPVLPKIDEAFAKSLGVEDGDINRMKDEIKESLQQEADKRVKAKVKEQAFAALVDNAEFELPKVMVEAEINRMMETAKKNLEERGTDPATIPMSSEMFEAQAKNSTKLRLILGEVINEHGLHANVDQIKDMVNVFSQSFEKPDEVVKWYYDDHKRLEEPTALATEENAVDWVLSQVTVKDKKVKFEELMETNS